MDTIKIEIIVSRRQCRALLCAGLLAFCAAEVGTESVSLTTYYPSPSGAYTKLLTTTKTVLATGCLGASPCDAASQVGIGVLMPAPNMKLHVSGNSQFDGNITMSGALSVGGNATLANTTIGAASTLTLGGGGQTVYRCNVAGAVLPSGALTTNSGSCGSIIDTKLRVP